MNNRRVVCLVVGLSAVVACRAEDVTSTRLGEPETETLRGAVVGGTAVHGPSLAPVGAVGMLKAPNGTSCTGTLAVRADRVLTAAHCICSGGNTWEFYLPNQASVPAGEIGLPPNCFAPVGPGVPFHPRNPFNRAVSAACFQGTAVKHPSFDCDDDLSADKGSDLAVVTLQAGVGATTTASVPATLATPQPVYLGPDYGKFRGRDGALFGFGAFHQESDSCGDDSPPLVAEFVRRTMSNIARFEYDPCDGPIDGACQDRPIWYDFFGPAVFPGKGDSGGPLFVRAPGATAPEIVGVLYGTRCRNPLVAGDGDAALYAMTADPQTDLHQSILGENRVWLANALSTPIDFNAIQVLTEPAVYATRHLRLNDRATVVPDASARAAVVAVTGDSRIEIRNDVQTMDVIGGGAVSLFDRVTINGDLRASLRFVIQGTQTVSGMTKTDTVIRVADLITQLGPNLRPTTSTQAISLEPGATAAPPPGSYGNVTVKSRATLFLAAGTYVFRSFNTEPESIVAFTTPGAPTYVVINGSFVWRGSTLGIPTVTAQVLWAVKGDASIQRFLVGTVLAPTGHIVVDTAGDGPAMIGALLARDIDVHQGKQIRHRPFTSPWGPALGP